MITGNGRVVATGTDASEKSSTLNKHDNKNTDDTLRFSVCILCTQRIQSVWCAQDSIHTWTDGTTCVREVDWIFTIYKAMLGSTQCLSIFTITCDTSIIIGVPTVTILISFTIVFTVDISYRRDNDSTCWTTLVRGMDEKFTIRNDALDRCTKW